MGDRTGAQLIVYELSEAEAWAVDTVIDQYGLGENHGGTYQRDDTAELGFRRVGGAPLDYGWIELGTEFTVGEVSCGAAGEIAAFLTEHAPHASWVVWEDPKYEWLGDLYLYTPELGEFTAECDSSGNAQFPPDLVRSWVERAAAGDATAVLTDMGLPWQHWWRDQQVRDRGCHTMVKVGERPETVDQSH